MRDLQGGSKAEAGFSELRAGQWRGRCPEHFLPWVCSLPKVWGFLPASSPSCDACGIWVLAVSSLILRNPAPPRWWKPDFLHEIPYSHEGCRILTFFLIQKTPFIFIGDSKNEAYFPQNISNFPSIINFPHDFDL